MRGALWGGAGLATVGLLVASLLDRHEPRFSAIESQLRGFDVSPAPLDEVLTRES